MDNFRANNCFQSCSLSSLLYIICSTSQSINLKSQYIQQCLGCTCPFEVKDAYNCLFKQLLLSIYANISNIFPCFICCLCSINVHISFAASNNLAFSPMT